MITFSIYFNFNGSDYSADILRIGAGPVQYHITQITPAIKLKGNMLIYDYARKIFTHAIDHDYYGIQARILDEIIKECEIRGVHLTAY